MSWRGGMRFGGRKRDDASYPQRCVGGLRRESVGRRLSEAHESPPGSEANEKKLLSPTLPTFTTTSTTRGSTLVAASPASSLPLPPPFPSLIFSPFSPSAPAARSIHPTSPQCPLPQSFLAAPPCAPPPASGPSPGPSCLPSESCAACSDGSMPVALNSCHAVLTFAFTRADAPLRRFQLSPATMPPSVCLPAPLSTIAPHSPADRCRQCSFPPAHRRQHAGPVAYHDGRQHRHLAKEARRHHRPW